MAVHRAFVSSAEAPKRQARSAASAESSLFRRHPVDSADRRGLALSTRRVSLTLDLLAAVATVARGRGLAGGLARAPGRVGCGRTAAMGGDLLGRQLRSGEKGGSAVGKTKRGKGTKWMVLVDGQGLPLGVRLESASPAE